MLIGFQYGQSQTRIVEETPQGQGPDKTVKSDDVGFSAQLAWRYHFQMGYGDPPAGGSGWACAAGLQSRSFLIDPTAGTSLPSSERVYPTGLRLPHHRARRGRSPQQASPPRTRVHLLRQPPTCGGADRRLRQPERSHRWRDGHRVRRRAWALSGEIWGPLGYMVRWRYQGFTDRYYGQGQKWTVCNELQCGGVGEESFHSIIWGITVTY